MKPLIYTLVLCCSLHAAAQSKVDTLSIEEAMNKKIVLNKITGKGGYQEECVQFNLENKSDKTVWIKIEAGRRLDSVDSTMQDILIVQSKKFKLNPFEKLATSVRGFCCQASLHAPAAASKFKIGSLASTPLVQLSKYINKHTLPTAAIQNAIWVISDGHDISSIDNSENDPAVTELQRQVSTILGIPIPWYTTYYKPGEHQVSSNQRQKITATVDYHTNENGHVIIQIISERGEIIEEQSHFSQKGTYHYNLVWEVENMPKGKYYLKIFDESRTIKNLEIVL